jgi:peptide chain release factor 1
VICSTSTRNSPNGGVFSFEKLDSGDGYIIFKAAGNKALELFKSEAGGHRWQRIPPTERKGRKHSSTITVAVLLEDQTEDVRINNSDLRVETMRGQGPGGQKRNVSASAVRITHLPTGITAYSDTKSQAQNKKRALTVIRARILRIGQVQSVGNRNKLRKEQVGSGMRADKIRTVAEQRGRVENHINGKRMSLKRYMRGFLEELL